MSNQEHNDFWTIKLCHQSKHIPAVNVSLYEGCVEHDIELQVGGCTHRAHRLILAGASDVFLSMFYQDNGAWVECASDKVYLQEDESCHGVFHYFLQFCYLERCEVTISDLLPLLVLANKYNLSGFMHLISSTMIELACSKVSRELFQHLLPWWRQSKMLSDNYTANILRRAVVENPHLVPEWGWSALEVDELIDLLNSPQLCLDSELIVSKIVFNYLTDKYNNLTIMSPILMDAGRPTEISSAKVISSKAESADEAFTNAKDNIQRLLSVIRFSRLQPIQLMEIEYSPVYRRFQAMLDPLLLSSYRFQAFPKSCRPATVSVCDVSEPPRIYTSQRYTFNIPVVNGYQSYERTCASGSCQDDETLVWRTVVSLKSSYDIPDHSLVLDMYDITVKNLNSQKYINESHTCSAHLLYKCEKEGDIYYRLCTAIECFVSSKGFTYDFYTEKGEQGTLVCSISPTKL